MAYTGSGTGEGMKGLGWEVQPSRGALYPGPHPWTPEVTKE